MIHPRWKAQLWLLITLALVPHVLQAQPEATMTDGGRVDMPGARLAALLSRDPLWGEALRIHYNAIVMDGHIDTPTLMLDKRYPFGRRHTREMAHVDLPRMFEGGLDAPFFSIYVAANFGEADRATERAYAMIDEVKRQVGEHSEDAEMAYSASDVRRITRDGRKAILMGLEGGHALQGSPEILHDLYDEGIRYVTLTHTNTNSWADASQSPARWNGLNVQGENLIRAMNQMGMLVDLSHTSDATFYDAIALSEAPVILSHSSMRALVNSVRNVDDAMLKAVAENGGVAMINFYEPMINLHLDEEVMAAAHKRLEAAGQSLRSLWRAVNAERRSRGLPLGTLAHVVEHIDHAVQVAGIDHVGLGSDFDGARMPHDLGDVTRLPWITYALLKRGYTEDDLYKLLGGNTLRVLDEAQQVAQRLQNER